MAYEFYKSFRRTRGASGISAYPLNTLQPSWTYSPPPPQIGQTDYGRFQTAPVLLNNQVVISLTDMGYLYALDAKTGAVISNQLISGFWAGGQDENETVIVGDGPILLVGDGPLYAYR